MAGHLWGKRARGAAAIGVLLAFLVGCAGGGSPSGEATDAGGGSAVAPADVRDLRRDLATFFADGMVVGPSGDFPRGAYPMSATRTQSAALERINWYRWRVGIPPIAMDAALNVSAQGHCDCYHAHASAYSGADGMAADRQAPAWDGPCTGETVDDRVTAAGAAGYAACAASVGSASSPEVAVDRWMVSLYQRLPIVHPSTLTCGYGQAMGQGTYVNAADFVRTVDKPDPSLAVLYPEEAAEEVSTLWNGRADPRPAAPPGGFPSGPVVTATLPHGVVRIVESLFMDEGGQQLAHVALDEEADERLAGWSTVALYAHQPLSPGTTYQVSLSLDVEGTPRQLDWHFRTRGTSG